MRYKCTLAFLVILMLLLTACSKKQVPSESESLTLTENRRKKSPKKALSIPLQRIVTLSMLSVRSQFSRWSEKEKQWKELREKAQENGCICSVAFLGTSLDLEEGMAGFLASEEAEQYLDAYPFIKEIPD